MRSALAIAARAGPSRCDAPLLGRLPRACAVAALLLLSVLAVSGCRQTSNQGTVRGTLMSEGGPPPGRHRMAGQVTPVDSQGKRKVANVPASGSFAIHVVPGTYRVLGSSPQFQVPSSACRSVPSSVTVETGATVQVVITCTGFF